MAKQKNIDVTDVATGLKKPSMKLVIISALAMALLGAGAGFGLAFFSFSPITKASEEVAEKLVKQENKSDQLDKQNHSENAKNEEKIDEPEGQKSDDHGSAKDGKNSHDAVDGNPEKTPEGETLGDHASQANIILEPVVTNISTPSDVWIRFESVLIPSGPVSKEISDQIHQDFMAFFRSLRLEDLQGASSFNALKAELLARANTRTEGKIKSLHIKTFLFE